MMKLKSYLIAVTFAASLISAFVISGCRKNEDDTPADTAKITYFGNGGVFMAHGNATTIDTIVKIGDYIPYPEDPVLSDYVFIGWCEDAACEKLMTPWTWAAKVEKDKSLYAKWGNNDGKTIDVESWARELKSTEVTLYGSMKITSGAEVGTFGIVYVDSAGYHKSNRSDLVEDEEGFHWHVTGLSPETNYMYYAYAVDGQGKTSESTRNMFRTKSSGSETDPISVDTWVTDVSRDTAVIHGSLKIASGMKVVSKGIVYIEYVGDTAVIEHKSRDSFIKGDDNHFYWRVRRLEPATGYIYYAYAVDTKGDTTESARALFTTKGTLKKVSIWENSGTDDPSWGFKYSFGPDSHQDGCIKIPQSTWDNIIKNGTFYLEFEGGGGDYSYLQITTGEWSQIYYANKNSCFDLAEVDPDNPAVSRLELNIKEDGYLYDYIDTGHLIFTGSGYVPLKLYYYQ